MRRIYTIGETVYDIIFDAGQIQAGKVGGSMLNASLSLGRLGLDVNFISEVGNDDLGSLVIDFLSDNRVNTKYIHRFDEGQTPLALGFLDDHKNAAYSFYKSYPSQRLPQDFPEPGAGDIVLFGSFFSISPELNSRVVRFVKNAAAAGAIIVYDPNIRHPAAHGMAEVRARVCSNFELAHIVRASHDDFKVLFDVNTADEAFKVVQESGSATLIFTVGDETVDVRSKDFQITVPVPKIEVLSTIGAGDNFNAGVIFSLCKQNILSNNPEQIAELNWHKIIDSGILMSQQVCKSFDNYIPKDFASGLR